MSTSRERGLRIVVPLLIACLAAGCTAGEPPEPEAGTFEWVTYGNAAAGYALEVPDSYRADEEPEGRAVLFRTGDGVPVKVYWMEPAEGEGRGLWFDETAVGEAELAGVRGRRFEYRHCDGPLCSRIVAFVIPHRGRSLALEFRSDGPLHPTNERILASFRLTEPT